MTAKEVKEIVGDGGRFYFELRDGTTIVGECGIITYSGIDWMFVGDDYVGPFEPESIKGMTPQPYAITPIGEEDK